MKKYVNRLIYGFSLFSIALTGCSNGMSKKTFNEEVDKITFCQYTNVEFHQVTKMTYFEQTSETLRDINAEYSENLLSWIYYNEEFGPDFFERLFVPNIKNISVEEIFEYFSPKLEKEDYKVTYTYYSDPTSFSVKVKGIKKNDPVYKDYKGTLSCEFDQYGWLIHVSTHFERFMIKTNSELIEEVTATYNYQ